MQNVTCVPTSARGRSPLIVIVGGGPVGSLLALSLAQQGFRPHVIERTPLQTLLSEKKDLRAFALARSSIQFFRTLGVWHRIQPHAAPVQEIRITQASGPAALRFFEGVSSQGDAMGAIVEGYHLRRALALSAYHHPSIQWSDGETVTLEKGERYHLLELSSGRVLEADLLVSAEGRLSPLRDAFGISLSTRSYQQKGLVTSFCHQNPHQGVAYERFFPVGPFATLPLTDEEGCPRSGLVWSAPDDMIHRLSTCEEAAFLSFLSERVPETYGKVMGLAAPRLSYPLVLHRASRLVDHRFALVGDAGHVMHPLAGQGLNLGLRDAVLLARQAREALSLGLNPGEATVLESYQRLRAPDVAAFLSVTHGLNALYSNESRLLRRAARLGLSVVNRLAPLKRLATRHAMGVVGVPGLKDQEILS